MRIFLTANFNFEIDVIKFERLGKILNQFLKPYRVK